MTTTRGGFGRLDLHAIAAWNTANRRARNEYAIHPASHHMPNCPCHAYRRDRTKETP